MPFDGLKSKLLKGLGRALSDPKAEPFADPRAQELGLTHPLVSPEDLVGGALGAKLGGAVARGLVGRSAPVSESIMAGDINQLTGRGHEYLLAKGSKEPIGEFYNGNFITAGPSGVSREMAERPTVITGNPEEKFAALKKRFK